MGSLVSGDIVTFLQHDTLETWGSDCASLLAPLLGHDSAFDTSTSPLSSEAPVCTAGDGIPAVKTSSSTYGIDRMSGSRPRAGTVPHISTDNEPTLPASRQRALQFLSRATIYGARPVAETHGSQSPASQSVPLCESIQDRRRSQVSDAGNIRLHGIQHVSGSGGEASRLSNSSELEPSSKACQDEFLKPYDFSMSRAFKFSDGSKIDVALERAL